MAKMHTNSDIVNMNQAISKCGIAGTEDAINMVHSILRREYGKSKGKRSSETDNQISRILDLLEQAIDIMEERM